MRLDKFLAENTGLTRSQASKALRQGLVEVNGKLEKSASLKISENDSVIFEGEPLQWYTPGQYIMLNKPQGNVCSHDEQDYPSVLQFFDYPLAGKLHCAGRLDVDTTGLVLLTDDGQWSHRLTSPKHHCEKTYLVTLADPIEDNYQQAFEQGILLRGEKKPTLPAKLEIIDDYQANVTLTEGRYHQVKRMFAALGNKVIGLHRWRVGNVVLPEDLEEGEWVNLSEEEWKGI